MRGVATPALGEREVVTYLDRDGTVTITGQRLAPDEAAAAGERLRVLAKAVKRAGHPGRLPQIQADLFCGLLNGGYHHRSQDEIIADLLTRAASDGESAHHGQPEQNPHHRPGRAEQGVPPISPPSLVQPTRAIPPARCRPRDQRGIGATRHWSLDTGPADRSSRARRSVEPTAVPFAAFGVRDLVVEAIWTVLGRLLRLEGI